MNGFNVKYRKGGETISVYAPTKKETFRIFQAALHDPDCDNIGIYPA